MTKTYTGSCHCGAVRFECDIDWAAGTTRCNCSFCRKARFWMTFVRKDKFRLLRGEDALVDYQHTPAGKSESFLHLKFCGRCGVRSFTEGGFLPSLGSAFCAVNVACLDDVTDQELAEAKVSYLDGRKGDWSAIEGETRHL